MRLYNKSPCVSTINPRAPQQLIPVRLNRIPQHPRILSFRFSNIWDIPQDQNRGNFPMISHLFPSIVFRSTLFLYYFLQSNILHINNLIAFRRPNQTCRCPQPLSAHSSHKRVERATQSGRTRTSTRTTRNTC